jgi:hypothetical protein
LTKIGFGVGRVATMYTSPGSSWIRFHTSIKSNLECEVVVEPVHRQILGVYISRHRNMIVARSFMRTLIKIYDKHTVYSDGGAWCPVACISLELEHRLHSPYEKSIVERTIEYLKDRADAFNDYYPSMRAGYATLDTFTNGSFCSYLCTIDL